MPNDDSERDSLDTGTTPLPGDALVGDKVGDGVISEWINTEGSGPLTLEEFNKAWDRLTAQVKKEGVWPARRSS